MKVQILIAVPEEKYYDNCTLVFKTLRFGFPTAKVHVTVNAVGPSAVRWRATNAASAGGADGIVQADHRLHHADWIKQCIEEHQDSDGPLIILDGDCHFWKSCEDWKFDALMAGYYVPEIWNDWSQCRSMPRLHASFLWFKDVPALRHALKAACPLADEYIPYNPFMGSLQFINGEPIFWDTCSNLYNTIGGAHFGPEHLACYEHLNSSGFRDEMARRMGGKTGEDFTTFHTVAANNMEFVRTFGWSLVGQYYIQKRKQAELMNSNFRGKQVDQMALPR